MSFGSDKSSSSSKVTTTKDKPPKFSTEYGKLWRSAGGNPYYEAYEPADVRASRDTENKSILDIVGGLPTKMNVEDLYNNPFYETTSAYYRLPIERQQQMDKKELQNKLTASNQLGSSYDAYANYLQNQQYSDAFAQAENQARLSSADAYTQALNNQLNVLGGLGSNYQREMSNYYAPLDKALGLTSAYAPYINSTTTGTQLNSTTPSFLSQYNNYLQSNAAILKALTGGV